MQFLRKNVAIPWISTDVLSSIDNKTDSTSEIDKYTVEMLKIGFKLDKLGNGWEESESE